MPRNLTDEMTDLCLRCFDGQTRLLVRSLMSGVTGAHRAVEVFHRQQRVDPHMTLNNLLETLCRHEITKPVNGTEPLNVKPLVCLFPASFKQNLLSFMYLVQPGLHGPTTLRLLTCLKQDSPPNPWVTSLCRQVERSLEKHHDEDLFTSVCSHRLNVLSQRLGGFGETGGWRKCFSSQTVESDLYELGGTQKKRKMSFLIVDSDGEETGQCSKRIKVDENENEQKDEEKGKENKSTDKSKGDSPTETPAPDSDALPENIKVSVLQIKQLLESQTEWDQSSTDLFNVLNECNPHQVELLCSMLNLPDIPDQTLPKVCSSILSISPDLSYSTAATLIKSLLLKKFLSLSELASRCLVGTITSLCGQYPRPMCHALIQPVLEEKDIGHPQTELLSRLMDSCLDSHYRLLVFQMTFKITWSEPVLSVIHSFLDSKPVMNEELFTQFTEQLVSHSINFTKSVKFAKMMLTVLTKFSSHVSEAHKTSLSSCLNLNETFLKKSLQAALKRIIHT